MGELRKRVLAGSFLAPVVAAIFCFSPPFWFFIFLTLVVFIALNEIAAMATIGKKCIFVPLSLIGLFPLYFKQFPLFILWLLLSPFLYPLLYSFIMKDKEHGDVNEKIIKGTAVMLFGEVFIVVPFFSIYMLRELNDYFPFILLLAVWASDIGAFIAGKNFGKMPLAPAISPKKTYEGLLGAVLGSVIITVSLHTFLGLGIAESFIVGIAIGLLGQAGDLLESAAKRASGKTDSYSHHPGTWRNDSSGLTVSSYWHVVVCIYDVEGIRGMRKKV